MTLPPSARGLGDDDRALVEAARAVIDANTDAGPDEDGVHTMGAAVRDAEGRVFVGVNLYHFTGGPCAELVALASARAGGARGITTIVAVGNHGRGPVGPCGRDRQVLFDHHPGVRVLLPTAEGLRSVTIEDLVPSAGGGPWRTAPRRSTWAEAQGRAPKCPMSLRVSLDGASRFEYSSGMSSEPVDRLARIRALEEQRSVIAAAQAAEVAAFMAERAALAEAEIAAEAVPGVGSRRRREAAQRQAVAEVATARRVSPAQARRFVTWACEAPVDTPETFRLVAAGELSERRAQTVAQVVAPLSPEQRRAVDAELAPDLPGWGDAKVETAARAAVYRIDPAGVVERNAYAATQRRVSFRPAPEAMGWLTALLPLPQLAACRAALERAVRGNGDDRGRGAVMADTLVERITGQEKAEHVPVAVKLLITDQSLLGGAGSGEPGRFADGSPYPASLARDLVLDAAARAAGGEAAVRVRRLFTDPAGRVVTAETAAREFTPAMAEVIRWRDGGTCTTAWCDAPIRHIDHHHPASAGGATSIANGRGTCAWCNLTKAAAVPAPPPPPPASPPASGRPPGRPGRPHRSRRSRLERLARRRIAFAIREQRCTLQR